MWQQLLMLKIFTTRSQSGVLKAQLSHRCSGCDGSFGRGMQVNALQGFTVDELKLNLW